MVILRTSAPAMVQPLPNGITPHKPSVVHRWIPPTWGWFWRSKEFVFGPSKAIGLSFSVFDCNDSSNSMSWVLLLKEPQFRDANGLQVWIRPESELEGLRHTLTATPGNRTLSSSRVTTADKVQARLESGLPILIDGTWRNVGLTVDCLPRIHGHNVDLSAVIAQTIVVTNQAAVKVSIQTNFSIAARIQIAKGSGVFLLQAARDLTNGSLIGIVISARVPPAKK